MQLKTDFTDGAVLYAGTTSDVDKLNGITTEINRKGVIHRKVYSSATEVSTATTGSSLADTVKTFDLSAPINSLILGMNIVWQTKNSASGNSFSALKINGTNLGTLYATSGISYLNYNTGSIYTLSPILTTATSSSSNCLGLTTGSSYQTISVNINKPLQILDTTTTFTVQLTGNSGTTYLQNVVIEIIYTNNYIED